MGILRKSAESSVDVPINPERLQRIKEHTMESRWSTDEEMEGQERTIHRDLGFSALRETSRDPGSESLSEVWRPSGPQSESSRKDLAA